MMHELYADNYEQRRMETLLRSEGRCENVIDGQRCKHRLGTLKISHAHNMYFEQLLIHHPNDDPWNPDAEMLAICAGCHMILHRKPDEKGKVPPRKPGYKVIGTNHLLSHLAGVGFRAHHTEECRVAWSFEPCGFEAEAVDMLDALVMCLHWIGGEVRDLQEALASAQGENRRLTDVIVRTQQAEERRQSDAALRAIGCRSMLILD
jgi:hypothetical protein